MHLKIPPVSFQKKQAHLTNTLRQRLVPLSSWQASQNLISGKVVSGVAIELRRAASIEGGSGVPTVINSAWNGAHYRCMQEQQHANKMKNSFHVLSLHCKDDRIRMKRTFQAMAAWSYSYNRTWVENTVHVVLTDTSTTLTGPSTRYSVYSVVKKKVDIYFSKKRSQMQARRDFKVLYRRQQNMQNQRHFNARDCCAYCKQLTFTTNWISSPGAICLTNSGHWSNQLEAFIAAKHSGVIECVPLACLAAITRSF